MRVAAADDGWSGFHQRMAVLGLPLVPDEGIVGRVADLIAGRDERVLLLGITRALAGLGQDLTAVDFNETQIERLWPGDRPGRRAVLGDWREMAPPRVRYTAAIGDGSLSTLAWPGEYRTVLDRVADALAPGGRVVIRCFIAPDRRETIEGIVDDVMAGREPFREAARWRIAMAATDADGMIAAAELAAIWRRAFPPLPELARRTGWDADAMELLLGSFERSTLRYSLVTRAAVLETVPASLVNARFVASGDYPLAERCPFLVAEKAT